MTDNRVLELDVDFAERLRRLARLEADRTSPWPGVDTAVRRSRRRRRLTQGASALACAGALALTFSVVSPAAQLLTPAAPRDTAPPPLAPGEIPGSRDEGTLGVTFGDLQMVVEFDVDVAAQESMPADGGECVFFDHPSILSTQEGQPAPVLDGFAADGCRGGIVSQPLVVAVDPLLPFADQPVSTDILDIEPCSLRITEPVTTRGGLTATRSSFDCAGGVLQQWVFDSQLLWSLDGDARIARLVDTAAVAVPR